jgi:hypothetical protein
MYDVGSRGRAAGNRPLDEADPQSAAGEPLTGKKNNCDNHQGTDGWNSGDTPVIERCGYFSYNKEACREALPWCLRHGQEKAGLFWTSHLKKAFWPHAFVGGGI